MKVNPADQRLMTGARDGRIRCAEANMLYKQAARLFAGSKDERLKALIGGADAGFSAGTGTPPYRLERRRC